MVGVFCERLDLPQQIQRRRWMTEDLAERLRGYGAILAQVRRDRRFQLMAENRSQLIVAPARGLGCLRLDQRRKEMRVNAVQFVCHEIRRIFSGYPESTPALRAMWIEF